MEFGGEILDDIIIFNIHNINQIKITFYSKFISLVLFKLGTCWELIVNST